MKILIDARLYGIENAGIGRYEINLINELQNIDNINKYIILLRKKYFNKVKLNDNFKAIETEIAHYSIGEQLKLPKIIRNLNPDVVHFPHFNVPIRYKDKYVVTIHDLLMHKSKGVASTTLNPVKYYLKRMGYRKVFDMAVAKSKIIITPSQFVKDDLLRTYSVNPTKIRVCYEGVDVTHFLTDKNRSVLRKYKIDKKYFLYVGNAYPHKNLKRMIEAIHFFNQGMKQSEKYLFVIVTSRSVFVNRLYKLIDKLNAKLDVKILHGVNDNELTGLYKNAVAFVYPSLHEGFGLPGLEAMSLGTLVLASDIAVFREIYKDNAIYFNAYDFSSIENSLQNADRMNQVQKQDKIKQANKFVEKYSWKKMALLTLKVYEEAAISA